MNLEEQWVGSAGENARVLAATILGAKGSELDELLARYSEDPRRTVQRALIKARAKREREALERARVKTLYERAWELGGEGFVLGVDEVGRGSVAGPLTVCALALPPSPLLLGLDDSKRLSSSVRNKLAIEIRAVALACGIYHVAPGQIDSYGMAWALRRAMEGAIRLASDTSGREPDAVLVDGYPMGVHPREVAVIHGDATVAPIAAASIVAKVTRDRLLQKADRLWPDYGFASSKGYASKAHISAMSSLGLTPYHRKSFCTRFTGESDQLSLF